MLRALVVLLLLANALVFGWARGWFAPDWPPPRHGEREPERLAAQVRPELIAAAEVGLEAGPFDAAGLAAAEAELARAGLPEGSWERRPEAPPSDRLWLRVPRAGNELQARLPALSAAFRPCEAR